jgi:hypothetical protein
MRANPLNVPLSVAEFRWKNATTEGYKTETAGDYLLVAAQIWHRDHMTNEDFGDIVAKVARDLRSMVTGEVG